MARLGRRSTWTCEKCGHQNLTFRPDAKTIARFKSHVVETPNGCWEWKGSRQSNGYGLFFSSDRRLLAHRAAWELFRGAIPTGLNVLHSCDNPPCCNPEHLSVGTVRENLLQAYRRGRMKAPGLGLTGEKNPVARLSNAQAREVRRLYALAPKRGRISAIARMYGVSIQSISKIVRGERYRCA